MSRFREELDGRIAGLRQRLADARAQQDELRESELLTDLETLIDIADRSDVDTTQMEAVLAAETGALPVIPDLTADDAPTGLAEEPEAFTATD